MEDKLSEKSGHGIICALQCSGKQECNEGKKITSSPRSDNLSGKLSPSRNKTKRSLYPRVFLLYLSQLQ